MVSKAGSVWPIATPSLITGLPGAGGPVGAGAGTDVGALLLEPPHPPSAAASTPSDATERARDGGIRAQYTGRCACIGPIKKLERGGSHAPTDRHRGAGRRRSLRRWLDA